MARTEENLYNLFTFLKCLCVFFYFFYRAWCVTLCVVFCKMSHSNSLSISSYDILYESIHTQSKNNSKSLTYISHIYSLSRMFMMEVHFERFQTTLSLHYHLQYHHDLVFDYFPIQILLPILTFLVLHLLY